MRADDTTAGRRRTVAGIASSAGALVLGLGLGALFPGPLGRVAAALVFLGAALHGWGMLEAHRLDRVGDEGSRPPWWSSALYWLCWLGLPAVVGALVVG